MSGFENDVMYAKNADFTAADNQNVLESNGLVTDGKVWIGSTALNAGGTHVNVGSFTSPDGSIIVGYSSPNITLRYGGMGATLPFVSAYLNTALTNKTGDNTNYSVVFDSVTADATSSYNSTTGVFTAPISGNYQITSTVTYSNVDSTFTLGNLQIATSGAGITQMFTTCNPGKLFNVNNNYTQTVTANVGITAGTTVTIDTRLSGGTKTVGISGALSGVFTYLNIVYIRA